MSYSTSDMVNRAIARQQYSIANSFKDVQFFKFWSCFIVTRHCARKNRLPLNFLLVNQIQDIKIKSYQTVAPTFLLTMHVHYRSGSRGDNSVHLSMPVKYNMSFFYWRIQWLRVVLGFAQYNKNSKETQIWYTLKTIIVCSSQWVFKMVGHSAFFFNFFYP